MKLQGYIFGVLLLVLVACQDDDTPVNNDITDPVSPIEMVWYENPGAAFPLKASIFQDDLQLSVLMHTSDSEVQTTLSGFYVYDSESNVESVILLDEFGEPTFVYSIDPFTGEKNGEVLEFERIDAESFYVRIYHYDWDNRLGTLLNESKITSRGTGYDEEIIFESAAAAQLNALSGKQQIAFPHPLPRLEKMANSSRQLLKTDNESVDEALTIFIDAFHQFINSEVVSWMNYSRNAGAVILGAGTVGGLTPAIAGGAALIAVSSVVKTVVSDQFFNFLDNFQTNYHNLQEQTNALGSDVLSWVTDPLEELSSIRWSNPRIDQSFVSTLVSWYNANQIMVYQSDLDDLPDSNGVLQIGLSWNTNLTDIDLWVTDPHGETIKFSNPYSSSGGYLDRDDVDGFGPENIYWLSDVPDGTYIVAVHYYGCENASCPETDFTVGVVNGLGFQENRTGTLSQLDGFVQVMSFNYSNRTIELLD
ncbi:YfaP family protein [Carboxylicivirga taeanensis]|uniref:YfaP family protein n=1 Tax=Carboxylicivirga taeanensis TaxID=1416875 RepID=UPI003F6DE714